MRTATATLLLLCIVLAPLASAQDAPAKPPENTMEVRPDGSVAANGRITRFWQVNHQVPAELQKELVKFLGPEAQSKISIEAKGKNLLRIDAPEEKWPIIEKLLEVVDVPDPQVFVEAKIIEIKYDSNLEFGFEAGYNRRAATDAPQTFFGKFTGTFNPESYLEALGTSKPFQGGTFEFANTGKSVAEHGQFTAVIRALQERGHAELLSQPSIIALQGEKATINTGVEFPVQSVDIRGNQSVVTTTFKPTGITLEITPDLVGRDYVKLTIRAEDKQITDRIPGPEGSLLPVVSSRTANTKVSVRDGETIVIGGLLTNTTSESRSGLPLLSDIPILGYLFSSTRKTEVKSELVFFITPRIIKRKEMTVISPPAERTRLQE